jgi:hypothetical protein
VKFNVKNIPPFGRELKNLAKKYSSLKKEYQLLLDELEVNPKKGIPLGKDCYKIRLAIASKGKGKSGGARVVTCVKVVRQTVYLLAIFDKSEMENIDDEELKNRLNQIGD